MKKTGSVFDVFVKKVFEKEELNKRLKSKAKNLEPGDFFQFFIHGQPKYVTKTKENKFKVVDTRPMRTVNEA